MDDISNTFAEIIFPNAETCYKSCVSQTILLFSLACVKLKFTKL
ncbi:hypothetical protein HCUR_00102 [Holospora curviuscula]|uniref:Uncharacterized protein n=1 Tax=Holospora curviuscula TaxID=1082868 RepID=A0A2S5RHY6_9PROT|nr:hypothetical protein HCUR_00102 [Holospora curviuscula]